MANTTFAMPCTNITTACSTRELLIPYFLRAHHNVDTHNKPCKPLWSRTQAADAFLVQTNFCATGIVNGDYVICRSVRAEEVGGCVDVKTDPPCGSLAEV
jgi:hypothetical protein